MRLWLFIFICFITSTFLIQKSEAIETYEVTAKKLIKFMQTPEVVYLSSIGKDGWPWVRAMLNLRNPNYLPTLQFSDSDFGAIFITDKNALKVTQFVADNKAGVYYYNPNINTRALYIKGYIEIISDEKEKMKYLPKPHSQFYPPEAQAKDYLLLKFNPVEGISYYRGDIKNFNIHKEVIIKIIMADKTKETTPELEV